MKQKSPQYSQITPKESSLLHLGLQESRAMWLLFLVGVFIYLNTLFHAFTQDDAIVIYDNMYTTQGVKGLKGIFTKDTFFGFFKVEGKEKLVSGGRYRPFTPAMFAIEYQLAGKSPFLGHFINILLYGFLGLMTYKLLMLWFKDFQNKAKFAAIALVSALVFIVHPIHTEVVANIKGRDEIMSMFGSIIALYYLFNYVDLKEKKYLYISAFLFFIALMSKENAITILLIAPISLYFFRNNSLASSFGNSAYLWIPALIFIAIRTAVLGLDFGGAPNELMNNPFLKWNGSTYVPFSPLEKMATTIFTLGKYVMLLFFPHPLTHDYYPKFIEMMQFSNWKVLLALGLYASMTILAIRGFKEKSLISFGILWFLITLSIVSNIVFPIGTFMSERFMFMPSLGFAIGITSILYSYLGEKVGTSAFYGAVMIICGLMIFKTVTRNSVWKNDFTLFTTDVKTSKNSAKVLNAAGGALTNEAYKMENSAEKTTMLQQAIQYLNQAIVIHPTYKNPYLILGNAHYYLSEYEASIKAYQEALKIDPSFEDASTNLAIALRDAGRVAGEKENNLVKAEQYLMQSIKLTPNDIETMRLLGIVNGLKGDHSTAITYFEKVVKTDPKNASSYLNLGAAYRNSGDLIKAQENFQKAQSIDPNILKNTQ
ncbi:MAG: tetratricopeptide repeat protein [Saprospiraceae bacterium]